EPGRLRRVAAGRGTVATARSWRAPPSARRGHRRDVRARAAASRGCDRRRGRPEYGGGVKLAPSILSADFAQLGADVDRVAPAAALLQVDVMDGHFVPNLTIGPPVVQALRKHTDLFLDCHLMVDNPAVLLDDFADAGADRCIVHIELGDPRPLFAELRARNVG